MAVEDQSQGLYSVRIDYIDTSKAYTIVIPLMPELSEEAPAWRRRTIVMAVEDQSQGLYSVRIDYIDTSKAYTIVIPLMPELSEEAPAWSLRIPLK